MQNLNLNLIDISAWQQHINWQAILDAHIDGVIIKLGEYTSLDEMFIRHVNDAVEYNLPYGVYYYAHAQTISESINEALWVDQMIKTYLDGENPPLGIWYDAEDESLLQSPINPAYMIGNFINKLNELDYNYVGLYSSYNWLIGIWYDAEDESLLQSPINPAYMIGNFINKLNELDYNYVGLYSSYNWLMNIIDLNLLADYIPIWVAQYYHENSFKQEHPERICKIWQYTDHKQIDDMCFDCNIYYA